MANDDSNYLLESYAGRNRGALNADLEGKIIYDDPAVFKRLRTHQVDHDFVTACAVSFHAANKDDVTLLKDLAAEASNMDLDELEDAEAEDRIADENKEQQSGNYGSAEEQEMYQPLLRLFHYVANFGQPTAPRKFRTTIRMLKPQEPHTFGFPSHSPDITISPHEEPAYKSRKWRDRDAFGEVKPSNKQRPKPAEEGEILIFGTEFSVGIFDREGITFSPAYDMLEDPEQFIRVVRSLLQLAGSIP